MKIPRLRFFGEDREDSLWQDRCIESLDSRLLVTRRSASNFKFISLLLLLDCSLLNKRTIFDFALLELFKKLRL